MERSLAAPSADAAVSSPTYVPKGQRVAARSEKEAAAPTADLAQTGGIKGRIQSFGAPAPAATAAHVGLTAPISKGKIASLRVGRDESNPGVGTVAAPAPEATQTKVSAQAPANESAPIPSPRRQVVDTAKSASRALRASAATAAAKARRASRMDRSNASRMQIQETGKITIPAPGIMRPAAASVQPLDSGTIVPPAQKLPTPSAQCSGSAVITTSSSVRSAGASMQAPDSGDNTAPKATPPAILPSPAILPPPPKAVIKDNFRGRRQVEPHVHPVLNPTGYSSRTAAPPPAHGCNKQVSHSAVTCNALGERGMMNATGYSFTGASAPPSARGIHPSGVHRQVEHHRADMVNGFNAHVSAHVTQTRVQSARDAQRTKRTPQRQPKAKHWACTQRRLSSSVPPAQKLPPPSACSTSTVQSL